LSDARLRQVTWPSIEAHRDYIVKQLADEVTVSTISARLAAERGLTASESSVRRWITANLAQESARRRVSVPRGPVQRVARPYAEFRIGFPHRRLDDRDRAVLRRMVRLADRPDTPQPQRPGEIRIRPVIPQGCRWSR